MKRFTHIDASSIDEAASLLKKYPGDSYPIAGGSDLLGGLKDNIWMRFPQTIVNLKTIPGLTYIKETAEGLEIGALTTLTEVAASSVVKARYPALAEAARRTASPLLRNIGTLAGNICQENRCWYYRYPSKLGGRIDCVRKGGTKCLAVPGDHRFHSIFGAVEKCIAVNPSDTAPALIVLNASIVTTQRTIPADKFFSASHGQQSTVLEHGELVVAIKLPKLAEGSKSWFNKIAYRKSIDFALVNCAVSLTTSGNKITAAKICLNGVYNNPKQCTDAEEFLIDKESTEQVLTEAAELAVKGARPLLLNTFKVQMARTIVLDTLNACK